MILAFHGATVKSHLLHKETEISPETDTQRALEAIEILIRFELAHLRRSGEVMSRRFVAGRLEPSLAEGSPWGIGAGWGKRGAGKEYRVSAVSVFGSVRVRRAAGSYLRVSRARLPPDRSFLRDPRRYVDQQSTVCSTSSPSSGTRPPGRFAIKVGSTTSTEFVAFFTDESNNLSNRQRVSGNFLFCARVPLCGL